MSCKVVEKFYCIYVVYDGNGFHMGWINVSCEHCLSRFLADLGGEVVYKKRFRELPPWEWVERQTEQAVMDWMDKTEEDEHRAIVSDFYGMDVPTPKNPFECSGAPVWMN